MRVLVCGGRDLDGIDVWNALEHTVYAEVPSWPPTCIIHGAARGADFGAALWAQSNQISVEAFAALWKKHGKSAGPIRNQRMIDEGRPDFVVAFPGGRGTADMTRRARASGIPVYQVSLKPPPSRAAPHPAPGATLYQHKGDKS